MVTTFSGQTEVSRLSAGDKVMVYDLRKEAFMEKEVLKVLICRRRRSIRITLANGTRLQLTPNHNIFVEGQWVRASAIKKGTPILIIRTTTAGNVLECKRVTSIDDGEYCDVVYNPIIEGSFSLIADGIVTHNFDRFKQAKMIYWIAYKNLLYDRNAQCYGELDSSATD